MEGFARGLVLKQRHKATQKWFLAATVSSTFRQLYFDGSTTITNCLLYDLNNSLDDVINDYILFFFYKNIFYKNIEAEICEILRIF